MSTLNITIYTLELIKNFISAVLNSFVLYITVCKFKLKGVDILLSFLICIFDLIFCLHSSIHIILHAITDSDINQDLIYCKVYFVLYWVLSSIGFNCLITLGIVRYLAICRDYLIRRRTAILIVTLCSLSPTVFCIAIAVIANPKDNSNRWGDVYPKLNVLGNEVAKKMGIFLSFSTFIYLAVLIFCYCNIGLYYYRTLSLLQLQARNSLKILKYYKTAQITRVSEDSNHSSIDLPERANTNEKLIKSQKLSTCVKYSIIMVIFSIQILPASLIHTIVIFYPIPRYTMWDTLSTFIINCIPATNPCFILFMHLESYQEFKNLLRAINNNFVR